MAYFFYDKGGLLKQNSKNRIIKKAFIICKLVVFKVTGLICLVIGAIGIFLPIIPGVPLLLLGCALLGGKMIAHTTKHIAHTVQHASRHVYKCFKKSDELD